MTYIVSQEQSADGLTEAQQGIKVAPAMKKREVVVRVRPDGDEWNIDVVRRSRATPYYANLALTVVKAVVKRQDGYLRHGEARLAPMCLQDIADDIGIMHHTTVSRLSNYTVVDSPQGRVLLTDLFSRRFIRDRLASGSADVSCRAAHFAVAKVIEKHRGDRLSDRILAQLVYESSGIAIARRTVKKIRQRLGV